MAKRNEDFLTPENYAKATVASETKQLRKRLPTQNRFSVLEYKPAFGTVSNAGEKKYLAGNIRDNRKKENLQTMAKR